MKCNIELKLVNMEGSLYLNPLLTYIKKAYNFKEATTVEDWLKIKVKEKIRWKFISKISKR